MMEIRKPLCAVFFQLCCALFLASVVLKPQQHHASAVIMRDYNYVQYYRFETYDEFKATFVLDDGTVNNNVFLGVASEDCLMDLESPAFLGAQRHGGGDILGIATLPPSESPIELTECAQIFFYVIGSPITTATDMTANFQYNDLNGFMSRHMRLTGTTFTNNFPYKIKVWWHEESQEGVNQGTLDPGSAMSITSFLGHIFSASAYSETGSNGPHDNVVDYVVLNSKDYSFNPQNRLETCEVMPGQRGVFSAAAATDDEVDCENMEIRLVEFTHQIWHEKRMGLNFVQPQIVRPVTEAGFENRRLPDDTYAWLKEWYKEQQRVIEIQEGGAGPCMNQHVAPTAITHLTPHYKDKLSEELQDVLEEWYGGQLLLTSIYGVRKYNNGSVLRMHVDTVDTHVVSAIINVDQEVDVDWPLKILDHDGMEHDVIMRPGDMLLYESAKLLHGRPDTFVGSHYDNIFIHYKPTTGWDYSWM